MKTIRIIIIAILIGSTVMPFMPVRLKAQTSFVLQVKSQNPPAELMKTCAAIISDRIKDYTGKEPKCEIVPADGKISIHVNGEWNPEVLMELAVRKGEMNIYEVIDPSSVLSYISAESDIAKQIRDASLETPGRAQLFCVTPIK
jgi:hypothetical protein